MHVARKILIYCDKGSSELSALAIQNRLQGLLGHAQKIRLVDSHYLRTKSWETKTDTLVIGGGSCSQWEERLQFDGMQKIHDFVFGGGKYLGICAGAYFGAAYSEFRLLGDSPLIKRRPLRFYEGCAYGPIIPTDNPLSPQAALALKILLVQQNSVKEGHCYYQGGPVFDIAESSSSTRVLMQYAEPIKLAAAISCSVGQGKAILCSPHPEFVWKRASQEQPLTNFLSTQEDFCQEIWKTLVCELKDVS